MVRTLFKTQSHGKLIFGNLLIGAIFLVLMDSLVQIMEEIILVPINALTSIVGAPLIIPIVLKRLR